MRISLANLPRLHEPLAADIERAVADVVRSGRYVGGPEVEGFEREFGAWIGERGDDDVTAIGVSSGTDALLASLMALGVGPGDEVITTPFTFAAPAQAIARLGATPVFVDIEPRWFGLDPDAVAAAMGPRTVGILPVHLYGCAANAAKLAALAEARGIWMVEDAAQAVGTTCEGRHAGTFGATGCFSFFPTKTLGALGDGGMVVTGDDTLAAELRRVRHHGAEPKYVHHRLGGNFRLDAIQAAALRVKLRALDGWLGRRKANAAFYREALPAEIVPADHDGHAWHQFVVRVPDRERIRAVLAEGGVDSAVYYPRTLDQQPCFEEARVAGTLVEAHRAADEVLAIPSGPELTNEERAFVADSLVRALG